MSGSRFELGIGAGNFWDAVAGMGGPRRTLGEAVDALEEAIPIIRAALDVGPEKRVVRGPGPHYPVPGYPAGPAPAHRVEIWIGAYRPRGLRLIGQVADGWVPTVGYMDIDALRVASARVDDAAREAGREPADIRRIYNVAGTITDAPAERGALHGPAEQWAETLATWASDPGVDAFVFWPPNTGTEQVERFAAEVVPATLERVARE
jgi:alkanesulfonate monooxygenase SsuD/methylene tetrahydromethanopterin reductase-like flavin-dependent oxidoreductase (luciferase family)